MKDRITTLRERFESYSLRERALIMLGVIVLVFMLWDTLIMTPKEAEQKRLVEQMHGINQQVNDINTQISIMSASINTGESVQMRARIDELENLLSEIRAQEKDLTLDFIRPEQMAGVLRELLSKEGRLELISLESLGAEPMFPSAEPDRDKSAETTAVKENSENAAQIYMHGMRVVLEGDYQGTLHFLKAIEAMPWRFYWDNVEYQVLEYPKARVAITVHTLSLEEDWIGV